MVRNSLLRASRLRPASAAVVLSRGNSSYAISNVTLADIEKRWEAMPPSEQAELWMQLRDRMKGSWGELTAQEKKACMFTPKKKNHSPDSGGFAPSLSLTQNPQKITSLLDRFRSSRSPCRPSSR